MPSMNGTLAYVYTIHTEHDAAPAATNSPNGLDTSRAKTVKIAANAATPIMIFPTRCQKMVGEMAIMKMSCNVICRYPKLSAPLALSTLRLGPCCALQRPPNRHPKLSPAITHRQFVADGTRIAT